VVTPCLCLVDKSKVCGAETSFDKFQIVPREKNPGMPVFSRPHVSFLGDIEALRRQPFVQVIDVTQAVDELLPEVRQAAAAFAASLTGERPKRIQPSLGVKCKKCEYRFDDVDPTEKQGFRECWGRLADPSPHLLDFYRVDVLGLRGQVAADMIAQGRCSVRDIAKSDLRGKVGDRQAIQLEWTLKNKEFVSPELPKILQGCKYPLHFIDFEASRMSNSATFRSLLGRAASSQKKPKLRRARHCDYAYVPAGAQVLWTRGIARRTLIKRLLQCLIPWASNRSQRPLKQSPGLTNYPGESTG